MNNNMNIHNLTQQIVSTVAVTKCNEVELDMVLVKSLQDMKDACLADIHETSRTARDGNTNRPPKKLKSSKNSSIDLTCIKSEVDQYDEGVNVYTSPIHISDLPDLHSSSSLAALLYNLALANFQRNQDVAALRLFDLARVVRKKDDALVDEIFILHNIGCIHYRKQEYLLAFDIFTQVEVLSRVKYGSIHLSVASALNCIGVVLFHTMNGSNSKNVLNNLLEALSIRKSILGTEHRDVATTLNNIGRVYFDTADYPNALLRYEESLKLRRNILGSDHLDVAATAFNAGQTAQKLGHLDKSLLLYQEHYDISFKKLGHHQGTVTVLKYISQVYHEKSQAKQASKYYQDALKSSRRVLGHFNRETASILNLLGNLHYENGDFDKAIEVYEEGLSIERVLFDRRCNNIAISLTNIGQALIAKSNYQSALSKFDEALCIQCLQDERNDKTISQTLFMIGQISTLLSKYPQAEQAFLKVISITKDTDHEDFALALNYLGIVYFKQGALDSAMEKFQESLCVQQCTSNVAVLLYNIASIYLQQGDNESALVHYTRALEVERRALGHAHPNVAVTLKLIGKVYDRCGQFEEAIKHYSQALGIYVKCYHSCAFLSPPHPSSERKRKDGQDHKKNAAKILSLIANVHLREAKTEEMMTALSQAYRLFAEIGAPAEELELKTGFDLYELSVLHPECAAAA